jgi:hypothetical protein
MGGRFEGEPSALSPARQGADYRARACCRFEPRLDGFRCLACTHGGTLIALSDRACRAAGFEGIGRLSGHLGRDSPAGGFHDRLRENLDRA